MVTITNILNLRVMGNVSCPVTNVSSTATTYAVVNWSDMLVNSSDFPTGTKGKLRVAWTNSSTATNYLSLYDQFGAAQVSGSEISQSISSAGTYQLLQTTTPFSLVSGLVDYMLYIKVSAGTMTIRKVEFQLVLSA